MYRREGLGVFEGAALARQLSWVFGRSQAEFGIDGNRNSSLKEKLPSLWFVPLSWAILF